MLDVLRSNAKSTFTWIIVVGIIVVFAVNFGPGSLSRQTPTQPGEQTYAATVNGTVLPVVEWERQYDQLYSLYRAQMGEGFTRELAQQLGLGRQAMERIVDRELVVQEARKRGLVVTRDELTRAVQENPSFQENGQFKFAAYEEWARQAYGSPAKFEAMLKDSLLYQQMLAALRETVKVPESEVRAAWEADADKVALSFVRFPLPGAEAAAGKPTDAEVKAFAEANADLIKKTYEDDRARWDQKRKVRVRHILARVPPGGDDAAARKKIEEAKARVEKGEDFAKVAAALSDDANTKDRGGEIGFVSEGLFDPAFAAAALALDKPGQLSDPVKSASGWHLVQAEEIVPAKQVPLEQASPQIARELLGKQRAKALADARARAALEAVRKGKTLAELFPAAGAKGQGVTLGGQPVAVDETGPFGRDAAFLPKLGDVPDLRADAFAAAKGAVLPKVYETPGGPVVAVVTLRERPDPAKYAAQRDAVETRLRNREEAQVVVAWLDALHKGAKIETNPALAAAAPTPE